MKKILLPLIVLLAVFCSGCKSETKDSSAQTKSEIKYYRPESESDSQTEPRPYELYYKKLYSPVIVREVYSGTVANFDYSLLDGYKFVGVIDKHIENNEAPDRDFVSNFLEEGTPLFYNEEKDSFIWWEQENAYDLTVKADNK